MALWWPKWVTLKTGGYDRPNFPFRCAVSTARRCRILVPDWRFFGVCQFSGVIYTCSRPIPVAMVPNIWHLNAKLAITRLVHETGLRFLARDSIYAIARYMPSPVRLSVRPSVRLSVTRVDQSKTVEIRITQPSPQSSPMTLVS